MPEHAISFKLAKSDPCEVASCGWQSAYLNNHCNAAATHRKGHVRV